LPTTLLTLNLQGTKISNNGLRNLSETCPSLQSLNLYLTNITDEGLKYLVDGCPQLEELSLDSCMKITDVGLRYLSDRCHELHSLNLCRCLKVTDMGLQYLAKECPKLSYLVLDYCKITDEGLRNLSTLEHLTTLKIKMTNTTPEGQKTFFPGLSTESTHAAKSSFVASTDSPAVRDKTSSVSHDRFERVSSRDNLAKI